MRLYQRVSSYLRCQIGQNGQLLLATTRTRDLMQHSTPPARQFGAVLTVGRLNRDSTTVSVRTLTPSAIPVTSPLSLLLYRVALSEIPKIRRREDRSYSGLEDGQVLYDCRWKSNYFKRTMYLKFAWNGEMVELFTLHEHRQ